MGPSRFFVVGDIGEAGAGRRSVGKAMRLLAAELPPLFVLTTGDNVYGEPNDECFAQLEDDLLAQVRVPWLVTLGNHDVKKAAYAWHLRDRQAAPAPSPRGTLHTALSVPSIQPPDSEGNADGSPRTGPCPDLAPLSNTSLPTLHTADSASSTGEPDDPGGVPRASSPEPAPPPTADARTWHWLLPGPMYSANETLRFHQSRTPQLFTPAEVDSFDAAVELVVLNTNKYNRVACAGGICPGGGWWGAQKKYVTRRLEGSSARWKVVVGHHPIEYIPFSILEHKIPGIRYFSTTFMKGGPASRLRGTSLRDHIVAKADLYCSGHQHLMAHLRNRNTEYCIVGNSAKIESAADCSDCEEQAGRKAGGGSSSSSGGEGSLKATVKRKIRKAAEASAPANGRIDEANRLVWMQRAIGFACVEASVNELLVKYFTVDPEGKPVEVFRRSVPKHPSK
ncbi:hypothetical protein DIPPA_16773 [Diplonema papillatum]|nr:hypothetical protein DIPPA_16773 [Diplonema papillatum]